MDSRAEELIKQGDNLFSKRSSLMNLWQEIGENFYPLRADFTVRIDPGDDMTAGLSTSYPMLAHRDMTNAISAMLRQRGTHWFGIRTGKKDLDEGRGRKWLEWASGLMYRAMYDRVTQFIRATKQGDADFAAFGQAVLYTDMNRDGTALLFRNYHLRDTAWVENADGEIDTVHRKWKPTARDLVYDFGIKNVHQDVARELEAGRNPYTEFECRHVMVPTERAPDAPKNERGFKYRSYFIDVANRHVIQDKPSKLFRYTIPRWVTISGSQYAYSAAVIAALPDARMIQAMAYTMLDAAEKVVQPPMIGQANMIKSDLELWGGGMTWVDAEYDEKLGEVLRPIPLDMRGLPLGNDAEARAREMIAEAFFLNKLTLPPAERSDMTAFETSQRIQEYIRQALPLFEPLEDEYNGNLCESIFDTLMVNRAFGPPQDMPEELRGENINFKCISPLQENEERKSAQVYVEARQLLSDAVQVDPKLLNMVDGRVALRDALMGAGVPARWTRDDDVMDKMGAEQDAAAEATNTMNQVERAGQVAEQAGKGAAAVKDAGIDALIDG